MKRICVYAGASRGHASEPLSAARALGAAIAEAELDLVFGGAAVGLMGAVADAHAATGGGARIGVIPEIFLEIAHGQLTEIHVMPTMHVRKQKMFDLADAFIALPGGLGTAEELLEVLTWASIGLHRKPIGVLECRGYYRHLLAFLDDMPEAGFCSAGDRKLLLEDSDPRALLEQLRSYQPPPPRPWWTRLEANQ
jgi:uncharacterized protein (TIGR00730 family)